MNWSNEGSTTALAGARTVTSYGVTLDRGEPRTGQQVVHVLVVPEREGADGALARRRDRWRWHQRPQHRPDVPRVVLHSLPAGEHEAPAGGQAAPDGTERHQWLVEEHHAHLAHDEIEGLRRERGRSARPSRRSRRCPFRPPRPGSARGSRSGAEMSIPTASPPGATAPASAMVRAPPPHPMSHTRWPGRASDLLQEVRRHGIGELLPLRPRRHPPVVVPPLRLPSRWPRRQRTRPG